MFLWEWLLSLINKFKDFVRVSFENPDTGEKNTNINKLKVDGNFNQNVNINVYIDSKNPSFTEKNKKELYSELEKGIEEKKAGIILKKEARSLTQPLSNEKRVLLNIVKRELKWSRDKITALRYALRICDLEEKQLCEEAQKLYYLMNKSKNRNLIRKMYNFTKSGYLQTFPIKHQITPLDYTNEHMDELLVFFGEAIWVSEEYSAQDVINELDNRLRKNIKNVTIYARGKDNISTLHSALELLEKRWESITKSTKTYMIKNGPEKYNICNTNAERVEFYIVTLTSYKKFKI